MRLKIMKEPHGAYNGIIAAVTRDQFKEMNKNIRQFGKPAHVLHDLKYVLDAADSDLRL